MKFKSIFFSLFIFIFLPAFSQTPPCGTMQHLQQAIQENPSLKVKMQQIDDLVLQRLANMQNQSGAEQTGVITIPVVFHVVYHGSNQNISNAQLMSQLDVLNEDYRRLNADTIYTPTQYQSIASDAHIEFCLAMRDPNNMPTSGITRTYTQTIVFNTNDNVKFNSSGGHNAWPANDYLNIWICKLGGGILGYAQFPGMSPNTDGIVLDYRTVGRPPANPFGGAKNFGRTATHEVGHWLNLRHIWGDGPCGVDDGVNDTPESDAPNFGCPVLHVSCGSGDMVQNYMDYTDDNCMNLFTQGQVNRMRDALDNLRPTIAASQACDPLTVPPLVDFFSNALKVCIGDTVSFFDQSAYSPYGWQWTFSGGNPAVSTIQNPKVVYNTPGTYSVKLVATNQYGSDSLIKSTYITITGANRSIPQVEGFENTQFPSLDWSIYNPDGDRQWERLNTVSGWGNSNASIMFDNFNQNTDPSGTTDGLISPLFDFSGLNHPYLTFDVAYAKYNNSYSDTLLVSYSTDCANTFIPIWYKGGSDLATAPNQTNAFTPGNNQWRKDSIDLSAFTGEPVLAIGFFNQSGWGNNLYIDNIRITDIPATAPVSAFEASKTVFCAGEAISFIDLSSNIPDNWKWSFPGGNTNCTTCQNPTVTYDIPGIYPVKLVTGNMYGNDSLEQLNYIHVFAQPAVSVNKVNVKCYGSNTGSINLNMTSGIAPFSYHWAGGDTSKQIIDLAAGTYSVTITDSLGCSITKSIHISQAASMIVNTASTPAGNQPNGTATVGVLGGNPPYSYRWDDPMQQTTAIATGLSAGIYHVTITDVDTCTKTATVHVESVAGINPVQSSLSFNIYPNPAQSIIQIEADFKAYTHCDISIFDALGRLVLYQKIDEQPAAVISLNISNLDSGIYLVKLQTNVKEGMRKLVILHE